jgi:hypothetical protein
MLSESRVFLARAIARIEETRRIIAQQHRRAGVTDRIIRQAEERISRSWKGGNRPRQGENAGGGGRPG